MVDSILLASDGVAGDRFGLFIAANRSGTVLVVGAPYRDGHRGAVYVYSGVGLATETILTASDAAANDFFGWRIAISDDGATIVIGTFNSESVYVYSGASWATETILTPAVAAYGFGIGVAISADASKIVIGHQGGNGGTGEVEVRTGAGWATVQSIVSSDAAAGDLFGQSVGISADGSVLVVAASNHVHAAINGSLYIFTGVAYATELEIDSIGSVGVTNLDVSEDGTRIYTGDGSSSMIVLSGVNFGTITYVLNNSQPQGYMPHGLSPDGLEILTYNWPETTELRLLSGGGAYTGRHNYAQLEPAASALVSVVRTTTFAAGGYPFYDTELGLVLLFLDADWPVGGGGGLLLRGVGS